MRISNLRILFHLGSTMRPSAILLTAVLGGRDLASEAFQCRSHAPTRAMRTSIFSTVEKVSSTPSASDASPDEQDFDPVLARRNRLVATAKKLVESSRSGKFITRPADKVRLQKAINNLEAISPDPTDKGALLGDWKLVATAQLPSSNIRSRLGKNFRPRPGKFDSKELSPIQKSIQKTLDVTQRIRYDESFDSTDEINRVDNVVEFTPLDTLESIFPSESPLSFLGSLNVNPLQIAKAKAVLVHKAEVESTTPVLRTRIAYISTVFNVAGSSQFFNPDGEDVFGVNNLLGDLQAGTFDTPYVDEEVRISRSSGPVLEQLRVFVREGTTTILDSEGIENLMAELEVEDEGKATVESSVRKVADDVTALANNARSTIEKDMEGVADAVSESMDEVVGKVQDAVEEDIKEIQDAVENAQSVIQDQGDVVAAVSDVTQAVAKGAEDVRSIVSEEVEDLGDVVVDKLDGMVGDVQDSVEADLKEVQKSVDSLEDFGLESDE
ncbi:hypothetical protein THAOC_25860 [Thalassiosira oceanica]|uniref:Plastid lipid-associated protein/fibrillin conserved domain-containing protein n=1 Tax=Thalassiosira oceanica TaxID=159749 RepID=K0S0A0_THAOC|nr:hypothetical protein THAOC_25860 [Thalassiosira oceanica]|eukprot:EJK54506.1 hypothetical protein THAOC_25860 [Thalassiosira oceanica]